MVLLHHIILLRYRYNSVMLEFNNKTLLLREKVNPNLFSSNITTGHDFVTTLVRFQNPDTKILDNIYPKWKTTHKSTSFQQPYKQLSKHSTNQPFTITFILYIYKPIGIFGFENSHALLFLFCCNFFLHVGVALSFLPTVFSFFLCSTIHILYELRNFCLTKI